MAKQDENQVEFELDFDELREELGINALEAENEALRELISEMLTYMNFVDLTVQELTGEPTVTERIAYNIPKGGRMQVQRERPPIPSNLSAQKLELVQKEKVED
jgi:hypothetical protein